MSEIGFKSIEWSEGFPDYFKGEMIKRIALFAEAKKSKALQKAIKKKCQEDILTFIDTFIFSLDPRLVSLGKPALVPFLPFPKQREYILLREECLSKKENLVLLKSRDAGASYITLVHHLYYFIYKPNSAMGLLSKKMDLIDRLGDTGTLFEKLRQIIKYLPDWMLPKEYFSGYARLVNYDNGSSIVGFSGEEAGRSSRLLMCDFDECAFALHASTISAAISQVTDCFFFNKHS